MTIDTGRSIRFNALQSPQSPRSPRSLPIIPSVLEAFDGERPVHSYCYCSSTFRPTSELDTAAPLDLAKRLPPSILHPSPTLPRMKPCCFLISISIKFSSRHRVLKALHHPPSFSNYFFWQVRALPTSIPKIFTPLPYRTSPFQTSLKMFGGKKEGESATTQVDSGSDQNTYGDPLATIPKNKWERMWPVLACGSGLFSDGYINNVRIGCLRTTDSLLTHVTQVIGSVSTMLTTIYGTAYTGSNAKKNVSAITFAGTVFGQLLFGYMSDKWSRKNSLLVSTIILIVFAALGAGSYGAGGSTQGLFAALTAYRFLVGVGIGQS